MMTNTTTFYKSGSVRSNGSVANLSNIEIVELGDARMITIEGRPTGDQEKSKVEAVTSSIILTKEEAIELINKLTQAFEA